MKGELLFNLPWILLYEADKNYRNGIRRLNRDAKTLAGIELFKFYISYFKEHGISSNKIIVLADSWFSNKTMLNYVKGIGVKYRLDAKKNYQVQLPDHDAISKRNEKRRGRKRKKFVKYCSLTDYFTKNDNWSSFMDSKKNRRVLYKTAEITLKTAGRVRVYAFKWKGKETIKFILTPPVRIRKPTAKRIYEDYSVRWKIEVAHRELKQQFSLSKSQSRKEKVVRGFIGIVNLTYSLWKSWVSSLKKKGENVSKCPTWAKIFHYQQIFKNHLIWGG